ncbi:MAG: EamA family transporter [Microvirga sp.]
MSSLKSPRLSLRAAGAGLVLLAAILWGTVGVASKLLFRTADIAPLTVGFYRLAVAAPLLFVLARLLPRVPWVAIDRRNGLLFVALGLTQAGYQGLYFVAVARLGVIPATLVALCMAPVLITILAALVLGERARLLSWLAVPVAVAGALLLVGFFGGGLGASGDAWGYAAAAGAALSYATFALTSRVLAGAHHPFQIIALGFGAGALMLMPFAMAQGLSPTVPAAAWGVILYMAVVPTALAYAVFLLGMRFVTATASGVLVLAEPLTAAVLAFVLFGEALGSWQLAGGGLLIVAVALVSLPDRAARPPEAA